MFSQTTAPLFLSIVPCILSVPLVEVQHATELASPPGTYYTSEGATLAELMHIVVKDPVQSYGAVVDESFDEFTIKLLATLRAYLCGNADIIDDFECVMRIEELWSQFDSSLEAEGLMAAALFYRSYLDQIRRGTFLRYTPVTSAIILTEEGKNIAIGIAHRLKKLVSETPGFLTEDTCFSEATCAEAKAKVVRKEERMKKNV